MAVVRGEPVTFSPQIAPMEPCAAAWLRQATLRLRREICWRWHQRGANAGDGTTLPYLEQNSVQDSLDLTRYWQAKQAFFQEDETAAYLTSRIDGPMPSPSPKAQRGSFAWVVRELNLDDPGAFALALGLAARLDSAFGPVLAACQNDATRTEPTLALVQRLWDEPERCLSLADSAHPLWRYGLLQRLAAPSVSDWDAAYVVPPLVAERLLSLDIGQRLSVLEADGSLLPPDSGPLIDRLRTPLSGLRFLPLHGPPGLGYGLLAGALAEAAGRRVSRPPDIDNIEAILTLAWLSGIDLLLSEPALQADQERLLMRLAALSFLPVCVYLIVAEKRDLSILPREAVLPTLKVPPLPYEARLERFSAGLGRQASDLEQAIAEAARRFRFEAETIAAVSSGLTARGGQVTPSELFAACRAASPLDAGELAQAVMPRFRPQELVLPAVQERQFGEIERAMRSLTTVHYAWGTGRVWNEGGISVLFAGPSGTGKTMAAEVLATKLDMPMYRINLAQIVNKYIGETEKNLERVFDAADVSETLLFFDEADALFGRRTDVRDAHDRYANLEVSYLLERMERFKGLAVLATNRRSDLDEAFLRRLRYIVDFPLPDVAQRRQIWERVIPDAVDASELDFDFLARQFQLAGGNIRSVVFNACLQLAGSQAETSGHRPLLTMDTVVVAVKREFDKLQRTVSMEQFGAYTQLVQAVSNA